MPAILNYSISSPIPGFSQGRGLFFIIAFDFRNIKKPQTLDFLKIVEFTDFFHAADNRT